MALAGIRKCTTEDICSLPDGQRAELIDGELFMMAPPNRKHQDISMALSHKIKDYILSNNGASAVYAAEHLTGLLKLYRTAAGRWQDIVPVGLFDGFCIDFAQITRMFSE